MAVAEPKAAIAARLVHAILQRAAPPVLTTNMAVITSTAPTRMRC
jgi:hypothetical protein